jgi:hypothetical protein
MPVEWVWLLVSAAYSNRDRDNPDCRMMLDSVPTRTEL